MKLLIDEHEYEIYIKPDKDRQGYIVIVDGAKVKTSAEGMLIHTDNNVNEVRMRQNEDSTYSISVSRGKCRDTYIVEHRSETQEDDNLLRAPMNGIVTAVKTAKGKKAKKGQSLIKLMSMKMENDIRSGVDARVKQVNVVKNQTVTKGEVLIEFEDGQ